MIINTPLIFDKSNNGCNGYKVPKSSVPKYKLSDYIPDKLTRKRKLNSFFQYYLRNQY